MTRRQLIALLLASPFMWPQLVTSASAEDRYTVLVVMSYEADNPWCGEIREGIESVLGDVADIHYLYMDTKVDPAGGEAMAAEALVRYRELRPDGVITVDDNAQSLFVVPHLKDKVETPVMFCGVNAEPEKYGFPASNVSGTLERGHVRESIAFVRQFAEGIQRIAFVVRDSPSGRALRDQVNAEKDGYGAQVSGFHLVTEMQELEAMAADLRAGSDALFVDSLEGIVDESGEAMSNRQLLDRIGAIYPKPILAGNQYQVEQGATSAVVKTGQEQGEGAARQLLKAMRGTPLAEIPVQRNYRGRRVINVNELEELGIVPRPIVLRGATLVRTQR